MTRRSYLVPRALIVSIPALLLAPGAGQAEDPPAPAEPPAETSAESPERKARAAEVTEEIVVTGSRIPRKDLNTPAPVTVFTREQILASGRTNVGEFLQLLPEQGNALNRQINNGGDGSTRIALRSLGGFRTLVLLNGRRYVASGVGADVAVDLNTIPAAAVERIDVLKDGASPMYGSEAMGGVVNIITRKRWSGVEAQTQAGASSRRDAASLGVNFTMGASSSAGGYLLTGGFQQLGSAMAGARAFSALPTEYNFVTGTRTAYGSAIVPAGLVIPEVYPPVADGNALWNALVTAYPGADAYIRDPSAPLGWRTYVPGLEGGDDYNYQPENYLVTPLKVFSVFGTGDRAIGDRARLYWEASYVSRRSEQKLASMPLVTDLEGVVVSAASVYNPFGRDLPIVLRRIVEMGPREFQQDIDTLRVVGGADGTLSDGFGPLAGTSWDLSANWGRSMGTQTKVGYLSGKGLADALGPSFLDGDGVARCGTPSDVIPRCVPLNLFGGPGTITQAMITPLEYTGTARGTNELLSLQLNAGRELFRIASERPVGLAAGYEYRRTSGEFVPDALAMMGDRQGLNQQATRGTADVHEAYAELDVPFVSAIPLVDRLEGIAAARVFKHGGFEPGWTWKLGARWRVVPDVTLRGTASTAYRVPTIAELYGGLTLADEDFVRDPCANLDPATNPNATPARIAACENAGVPPGGTQQGGRVPSPWRGNAQLRPETARVYTAGVVLEPRFVHPLSVTIDYWQVTVNDAIGALGGSTILDLCYPTQPTVTPSLCEYVQRDPTRNGALVLVDDPVVNGGNVERAAGVDLALRYSFGSRLGRFGAVLDLSWLAYHDIEYIDGLVLRGRGNYDLLLNPEWKATAGLTWSRHGLAAGVAARFLSSVEQCASPDPQLAGSFVPAWCSVDATVRHDIGDWYAVDAFIEYALRTRRGTTSFAIGATNLLDRPPPMLATSLPPYGPPYGASYDGTGYDLVGRYFYGRISVGF